MAELIAHIRRLGATDDRLYIRFDANALRNAGLHHGTLVELQLPETAVIGVVKTSGSSPWLAPSDKSSNRALSDKLHASGLAHGADVTASVRSLQDDRSVRPDGDGVLRESDRRDQMWKELQDRGGPSEVAPAVLRELGIYGGAQGVWVDKTTTGHVFPSRVGAAVGLLHTGKHYPDSLDDFGVVYHYPTTNRRGKDEVEVESIRACGIAHLPMFFIEHGRGDTRNVRRVWLVDDNPSTRTFYLSFHESDSRPGLGDHQEFVLNDPKPDKRKRGAATQRSGQARFRFDVLARYESACAMCGASVDGVVEAAHLKPRAKGGTNDPRNGLPLCRNHHRCFDMGLVGVEPASLRLVTRPIGPTLHQLQIPLEDLSHLRAAPHLEALTWAWEKVFKR